MNNINQSSIELEIYLELQKELLDDMNNRIKKITDNLRKLKKIGYQEKLVKDAFRLIHNIKGTSATIGLMEISTIAFKIEGIVKSIMDKSISFTEDLFSRIYQFMNLLVEIKNEYQNKVPEKEIHQTVIKRIKELKSE